MFNKETIGEVHSTIYKIEKDNPLYNSLSFSHDNRNINERNVVKIIESIKHNNVLDLRPVIIRKDTIKNKWIIIDGQHRYTAAVAMRIPFYVIVDKGTNPRILMPLNTNQKNWGLKDFAVYWSKQPGETQEVYTRFLDYKKRYSITYNILIAIYKMTTASKDGAVDFKNGKLRYDCVNARHVEDTLSKLDKLKHCATNPVLSPKTIQRQQFQQALLKCFATECFDYDRFLNNLGRSRHSFNKLAKQVDFMEEIFRIESKK